MRPQGRGEGPPPAVTITAEFIGEVTKQDLLDNAAVLSVRRGDDDECLYWCRLLPEGGFRLTRFGSTDSYDVSSSLKSCTCPDHQFRPRPDGCKHQTALRQALLKVKP
jgi:hypothetical protein